MPLDAWDGRPVAELRRLWGVPALHAFDACRSTSDVARALARDGAAHGTTVVADHQTAGRGRQGRGWDDRPGASLLVSMVLRPAGGDGRAASPALPLLVGLACARAIRSASGLGVGIEWPNDLVVADRKLGGILCESSVAAAGLEFVVAGVGINVGALPDSIDDATRARATSLADALGSPPPARADLAGELARRLLKLAADAPLGRTDLDELRALDSLVDRSVHFGAGREGTARGILPDGALLVEAGGERVEVRAGSVSPAGPRT